MAYTYKATLALKCPPDNLEAVNEDAKGTDFKGIYDESLKGFIGKRAGNNITNVMWQFSETSADCTIESKKPLSDRAIEELHEWLFFVVAYNKVTPYDVSFADRSALFKDITAQTNLSLTEEDLSFAENTDNMEM